MKNSKNTQKGANEFMTPKLRFTEFQDQQGWSLHKLGEKAVILKGKGISKADLDLNGSQPCIRYGELYTFYGETIQSVASRTNVPASELFLSKANDVIIPSSGETKIDIATAACVLLDDVALGGDLNVIRSTMNGQFLSYYLNGPKKLDIAKVAQGDTVVHLYPHQLSAQRVWLPSPAEQEKIAKCLSTLDELIGAESQKICALKAHKNGLMQQLFPREGETLPHLRFHEFQDAPEWEERRLEDLAKRGSGHTPSKAHPEYYNGGIRWISLADSRRLDSGLISETKTTISLKGINNSSAVLHPAGTVLVSRDAGVGKSAIMGSAMAVSQHFIAWTCDESKLSNWFLYHLLQKMKPDFERAAIGSTIKTIGLQFFIDLEVVIPSLAEQQRIATCLCSLDDLIAAQSDRLAGLRLHKQGLLQQLFPFPADA
ncbi:restriction endonuclease subunit S [Tahibacter sp.]|uniref:restriction endonuclease subunit S n=1 Tax=Tahibacter sp. TaxID=2056211 RepID=UPI0028C37EC3|nr:restriction endonuclease subunit S [Tahibacter sp.]